MLTRIFTLISVLLLLLKKPSSLGKIWLFSSPICSPQLPPKSFLKPSVNPGCPRCLGSLTSVNWLSKKKKSATSCFWQPTSENILKYKQLRAKARYTMMNAKQNCWRQFCSNLNTKTSCKTVWKTIRKLKGKNSSNSIGHILVDDQLITDKQSVANSLARCQAEASSSSHCSSQFQKLKRTTESKPLKFQSNNTPN